MSAIELSRAFNSGELSPVDVLDEVLKRVKRFNPELNAIVTHTIADAKADARKAEKEIKAGKSLPLATEETAAVGLELNRCCRKYSIPDYLRFREASPFEK